MTKTRNVDESWYKRLITVVRNRFFKDRLFKRVFRDKKYLLELYNALNDSDYTDESELEVVTMEDVVFLRMKNDISFIIGNTLNLYEHQSTVNNNIALRVFLYFAKQYEAIASMHKKRLYGTSMVQLPFPQCVVFYNGNEEIEEDSIVRLSDAFIMPNNKNSKELIPAVECTVRILNINYGHNKTIAAKCHRLDEYSRFIQIVKECDSTEVDKNKAMEIAVDKGINEGLLLDILIHEKAGVKSMLLTEFDEKLYKKVVREEGWEEGHAAGLAKGHAKGLSQGLSQGLAEGQRTTLISLVKSNNLPISVAAGMLNMTESEFTQLMNEHEDELA